VFDGFWIRKSDASFEFYASLLDYKVLTVWSRHFLGSSKELPIQREGLGSGLWCCHDGDEVAPGMDEGDVRCRSESLRLGGVASSFFALGLGLRYGELFVVGGTKPLFVTVGGAVRTTVVGSAQSAQGRKEWHGSRFKHGCWEKKDHRSSLQQKSHAKKEPNQSLQSPQKPDNFTYFRQCPT
jgi:hypothetical protein